MIHNNALYRFDYLSSISQFIEENGWPDLVCIIKECDIVFLENTAFGVIERVIGYDPYLLENAIFNKLKSGSVFLFDSNKETDDELWKKYGFKVYAISQFGKNNFDYISQIKKSTKKLTGDFEVYAFLELDDVKSALIKGDFVNFKIVENKVFAYKNGYGNFYEMTDLGGNIESGILSDLLVDSFPVVMSSIGERRGGEKYQTLIIKLPPKYRKIFS